MSLHRNPAQLVNGADPICQPNLIQMGVHDKGLDT